MGQVSTEYDLDNELMFAKFCNENLDAGQMYDFIRAEFLNLIIARKQFVKDNKAEAKANRKLKKLEAKQRPVTVIEEES